MKDADIVAIAQELGHDTVTKELFLSANGITDMGAIPLFCALGSNTTLRLLAVSDNAITDTAIATLALALKVNTTVKEIALANNKITDVGAIALAGSCLNLEKLSVASTHSRLINVLLLTAELPPC